MLSFLSFPIRIYLGIICFLFGLIMGSALNCLAYRIAHEQSWAGGRSACPNCGHTLGFFDLIPLFSWLFLRGKCRYCKAPISVRYPLSELCLAICYTALLFRFDVSLQTLSCFILVSCLFCLSLVDLEIQIIPDRFLLIPAIAQLAFLLYDGGFTGLLHGLLPALALGGGVLVLSLIMDKVLKKDSMGGGDIKLLFVLGLYFDFPSCLLLLVFACAAGIVLGAIVMRVKKDTPFPFGPALSLAALLTLLFGHPLIEAYLNFFLK